MHFLRSERLVLRQLEPCDLFIMHDYRNNPTCARYQRGQLKELDKIALLITKRRDDVLFEGKRGLFAIAKCDTGEMIGEVSLLFEGNTLTMGYTVSYIYHRQGYAFEILSLLLCEAFERYDSLRVVCRVVEGNKASEGLLLKLGFSPLGYCSECDALTFVKEGGRECT